LNHSDSSLRGSLVVIGASAALLVVLIVWANLSEIVQTSHAQAQVIAIERTQVIQAAIDGVVETVVVHEGQALKKGQLIARLDRAQPEAALKDSQAKVAALKAALVRLRAEALGKPLKFPPELKPYPLFIENQTELFQRRQSAMQADVDALNNSLALIKQELTLSEPLLKSGDVGQAEIIRLQRQAAEVTGQIANRRNKYFQDSQTEMTKAEEDLATQEQTLADRAAVYERTEIYAPADGLVKSIQATTPGAKVRAGDVILELLPTGSDLIVEAKLKPIDVASVRVGLPTSVKLDAYDYSIYGALRGKVSYVSPDALSERTAQGEVSYYRVQIKLTPELIAEHNARNPGKRIDIQPGMTAVVDIETGHHTVMSYLTKPVTKTFDESLRER
jgi:multidrug resistance efflux pump